MGFKVPKSGTRIVFDETSPYHGAEVVMSLDFSIDEALALEALGPGDPAKLMDAMSDLVLEWNLEDDHDQPIPVAALRSQPIGFVVAMFNGMRRAMEEVVSVDAPFGPASSDGGTSGSPS